MLCEKHAGLVATTCVVVCVGVCLCECFFYVRGGGALFTRASQCVRTSTRLVLISLRTYYSEDNHLQYYLWPNLEGGKQNVFSQHLNNDTSESHGVALHVYKITLNV